MLASNCHFEQLEDSLILDRLVVSIRDEPPCRRRRIASASHSNTRVRRRVVADPRREPERNAATGSRATYAVASSANLPQVL